MDLPRDGAKHAVPARTPAKKKKPKPIFFQQFLEEDGPFGIHSTARERAATLGIGPRSSLARNLALNSEQSTRDTEGVDDSEAKHCETLDLNEEASICGIEASHKEDNYAYASDRQERKRLASRVSCVEGLVPVAAHAVKPTSLELYPSSPNMTENDSAHVSRIPSPSQDPKPAESVVSYDKIGHLEANSKDRTTENSGPILWTLPHRMDDHTRTAPTNDRAPAQFAPMALQKDKKSLTATAPVFVPRFPGVSQGSQSAQFDFQVLGIPSGIPTGPPSTYATALSEHAQALAQRDANVFLPETIRPTSQNLRYGAFQGQQAPQSRNPPLGSGRLQNASKPGSGPGWGFGAPNGVSALPSTQPRQTGPGATSFAQTIGGQQPAASLDLSEFPSLSGTSQPQYQNPSQAIWANQRAVQQTPVQRPQHQQQQPQPVASQASQQHQQNQQNHDQPHRNNDDMFSASSHLQNVLEDHRYGGTGALGQLSSRQTQPTSVDDFPPLGRNGTDENDDRRAAMQNAGFGGFSNINAFSVPPDQAQIRNTLPSASSSQANNTRSSSVVDRLTSPNGMGFGASSSGRSPTDSNRQGNFGVQDHDRNPASGVPANPRDNSLNSLLNNFNDTQFPPQRQASQPQQPDYVSRTGDVLGPTVSPDRTDPSQMSAMEEYGLAGFLATARSENPDVSGLARGQDLTSLGLNLNSPEPLYPTFAGPFTDVGSRPLQPDFKLPECYVVDNVHRVRDKIPGFAEETLFWIFYNQPRDILQELAASELTNRNWRFHKDLRMWLTKDTTLPEPIQISSEKEQGSYQFFNPQQWEKVRVTNFELHYHQLAPSNSRPSF